MTMTTRYPSRSATSGPVTLNSARKGGNTLHFWYFIQIGKKWVEFDLRDLEKMAGKPMPKLCGDDDFKAIEAGSVSFEQILQRDLQRVADYCAKVDALLLLTKPQPTTTP